METSRFVDNSVNIDKAELINEASAMSKFYKLRIDGRLYFMKQLRDEFKDDPRCRALFFKEYENGKSIRHPYVVEYTSINEDEDGLYILMEYVNGVTLKDKLASEPEFFTVRKNLYLFVEQLLEALKALHSQNIIYLDLSPKNILLTKTENCVKLVDLGFSINDTNDYTAGCTKNFVAPETERGEVKEIDNRSDIYAVGCLLQYIEKETGVKLPADLQRIKMRCLQPLKSKRYASVNDILSILKHRKPMRCARISALLAVAALAVVAFVNSPLQSALCNYIGWQAGEYPDRFEADGIFYNITDHTARTVEITYKGSEPDEFEFEYEGGVVNIPQTVTYHGRTFSVTAVAGNALKNPYISKITIPEGIETLEDYAFNHCNLDGVIYIPASVKSIGASAFYPILYIDAFVVDAANRVYDSRDNCNSIIETATNTLLYGSCTSVIPRSVTSIAPAAFMGAEIKSLTIPESVTSIGEAAFVHTKIEEIVIPEGVTVLNRYLFQYCENMRRITLPKSLKEIALGALSHCALVQVTIPDAVTAIGEYAFDYNLSLREVVLGEGVRSIGDYAFDGCRNLTKVVSHIPAKELFEVNNSVFGTVNERCVLYVPKGAKRVYENTQGWNLFAKIVEM